MRFQTALLMSISSVASVVGHYSMIATLAVTMLVLPCKTVFWWRLIIFSLFYTQCRSYSVAVYDVAIVRIIRVF